MFLLTVRTIGWLLLIVMCTHRLLYPAGWAKAEEGLMHRLGLKPRKRDPAIDRIAAIMMILLAVTELWLLLPQVVGLL